VIGRLFFLEASGGRIHSANADGSDRRVIVTGCRIPDGIVVDVETGHIYWTNMGVPTRNDGSIERVDLNGQNRKTIIREGDTFTPKQLHLEALRRRAIEGGSYRVVVSLTRVVLWQLSLGIFDKAYAKATAGSTDEHTYSTPDLFTAETPLGTYQGMTDQIVLSRTPGAFRTVLVPRGSSKPEWLPV
jgi:low-density lipoprotein receptor class B